MAEYGLILLVVYMPITAGLLSLITVILRLLRLVILRPGNTVN